MKEWIENNKYVASLIGITAVVTLILGFLNYLSFSAKGELEIIVKKRSGEIEVMKTRLGEPTEQALKDLASDIDEGFKRTDDLYSGVSKPGFHKLDETRSATDFTALLNKYVIKVRKSLAKGKVKNNADAMFGFSKYREGLIKDNPRAIGLCLYQQDALLWLADNISAVGPCEINKLRRSALKEEDEDVTKEPKHYDAVRRMAIDLVVTMTEEQFTEFTKRLNNSKEHYFSIKHLAFTNTKAAPIKMPKLMSGTVVVEPTGGGADADPFQFFPDDTGDGTGDGTGDAAGDGIDLGGDPSRGGRDANPGDGKNTGNGGNPVPVRQLRGEVKEGKKVVEQVLGNEKIIVYMALNLMLVTEMDKLNIRQRVGAANGKGRKNSKSKPKR